MCNNRHIVHCKSTYNSNYTNANTQARVTKDKLLKNIEDNRVLTTSKEEERCREDLEEDMVTTIMANTKKLLARMRRSRELEVNYYFWSNVVLWLVHNL